MISVKFYCGLCGWRYWTVHECDDPMAQAIGEEARWHAENIERYGWPYPTGAEPVFAAAYRRHI